MLAFYLSIAFIIATIMTIQSPNSKLKKDLSKHLSEKELQYYQDIIIMRRNIYFQGLILGIILAIIIICFVPQMKKAKKSNRLYSAIAITFVVNYFYYILYPKDKYMIEILDTKEENKAWLNIYKTMQMRYHLGFLLGLLAASCIH